MKRLTLRRFSPAMASYRQELQQRERASHDSFEGSYQDDPMRPDSHWKGLATPCGRRCVPSHSVSIEAINTGLLGH